MISKNLAEKCFSYILENGGDFAEIFVESTEKNSLRFLNSKVEAASSGLDFGLGLRVFSGLNSVYVYSNDSSEANVFAICKTAINSLKNKSKLDFTVVPFFNYDIPNINIIKTLPSTVHKKLKADILKQASNITYDFHESISEVIATYGDSKQDVLIANTDGFWKTDQRVRTRISISAVASSANEKQIAFFGPGAQLGHEFFETLDIEQISKNVAETALRMLSAKHCEGGSMPVVLGNGFGGVLFHEACGHSLEASSVAKNLSVFSNRLDTEIASPLVTAIDDGTIPNAWGSLNIDDEGTNTQKNVLIENGVLKSYMIDILNARRMQMEPTGSGRRESYRFAPTARMTNTYIANGKSSLAEIIANTEYALYAKSMGGGSVDPGTGTFNFSVSEGFMIRNGKIAEPVRGAALIGKGEEILKNIDMVADDLKQAQGSCGAESGTIPTNVGQPSLRVSKITVGGRA